MSGKNHRSVSRSAVIKEAAHSPQEIQYPMSKTIPSDQLNWLISEVKAMELTFMRFLVTQSLFLESLYTNPQSIPTEFIKNSQILRSKSSKGKKVYFSTLLDGSTNEIDSFGVAMRSYLHRMKKRFVDFLTKELGTLEDFALEYLNLDYEEFDKIFSNEFNFVKHSSAKNRKNLEKRFKGFELEKYSGRLVRELRKYFLNNKGNQKWGPVGGGGRKSSAPKGSTQTDSNLEAAKTAQKVYSVHASSQKSIGRKPEKKHQAANGGRKGLEDQMPLLRNGSSQKISKTADEMPISISTKHQRYSMNPESSSKAARTYFSKTQTVGKPRGSYNQSNRVPGNLRSMNKSSSKIQIDGDLSPLRGYNESTAEYKRGEFLGTSALKADTDPENEDLANLNNGEPGNLESQALQHISDKQNPQRIVITGEYPPTQKGIVTTGRKDKPKKMSYSASLKHFKYGGEPGKAGLGNFPHNNLAGKHADILQQLPYPEENSDAKKYIKFSQSYKKNIQPNKSLVAETGNMEKPPQSQSKIDVENTRAALRNQMSSTPVRNRFAKDPAMNDDFQVTPSSYGSLRNDSMYNRTVENQVSGVGSKMLSPVQKTTGKFTIKRKKIFEDDCKELIFLRFYFDFFVIRWAGDASLWREYDYLCREEDGGLFRPL